MFLRKASPVLENQPARVIDYEIDRTKGSITPGFYSNARGRSHRRQSTSKGTPVKS